MREVQVEINNKNIFNFNKFSKIMLWLLSTIVLLEISFGMINQSSGITNIIGFLLLIGIVWISFKTKCFLKLTINKNNCLTNLKIKKNEKND